MPAAGGPTAAPRSSAPGGAAGAAATAPARSTAAMSCGLSLRGPAAAILMTHQVGASRVGSAAPWPRTSPWVNRTVHSGTQARIRNLVADAADDGRTWSLRLAGTVQFTSRPAQHFGELVCR